MLTPSRSLRSALFTLLTVVTLGAGAVSAQVARPYDIGLEHAKTKPYNFTGRVFIFDDVALGFGSATLIRRHTALTAAHVIYEPTVGFISRASFSRGLYKTYSLQKVQVASVNALTGYATAAATDTTFFDAAQRDLAYLVFSDPPVDEDWAVYTTDTSALTDDSGRFVLGYPGVTFDGRTQAYIVPTTPFVQLGIQGSGSFQNEEYIAEEGMSGGPIYVFRNGVQQVVAETVGGLDDTTGTFNFSIVRALNAEAGSFLASAEYTSGLIKKVKISGPSTVARGSTQTFTVVPKFSTANVRTGKRPTTDRYSELTLVSDVVGTSANPAVTIRKVSNTRFNVTFSSTLRSRSLVTLTANYAPNAAAANSSFVIQIQ